MVQFSLYSKDIFNIFKYAKNKKKLCLNITLTH